jgi:hypothetical protein
MQTACTAYAKVLVNKRLNTVRLLVTFDSTKRDKNGNIVVTVKNCAYASGDIATLESSAEYRAQQVARTIAHAKAVLRTDNFMLV